MKWQEHFQHPEASKHELAEYIKSGKINEQQYLSWATENYQIPLLADDFFKTVSDFKMLAKNTSAHWNNHFFPIQEWNGVLYIACLEPQDISLSKKTCFVLGSVHAMEELWKKMEQIAISPHINEAKFDVPEITSVVKNPVKTTQKKDASFTSTKTIMPFPERSTQFSFVKTVISEQIILDAQGKIQEAQDPHQALISAFHILKDYYKKLMWVVRDQQGQAYPIACTANWDFTEEAWNTPINFLIPNPFRIAKFTQKPYHGKVYPNSANEEFFKHWNSGNIPEVFSVVPIKLQGKVFAYFVGCDPGMHFNEVHSLEIMQSSCNELVQKFVNLHNELSLKAAA